MPLTQIDGCAAPMFRANIDTDTIIPSREIKGVSKTGLADGLFAGLRYQTIGGRQRNDDFVLNRPEYQACRILIAGENFGCGSSREHAVWALHEFGIRAVIAPSFAPIFEANCVRNGLVPVRLTAEEVARLAAWVAVDPLARPVRVDVVTERVSAGQAFEATFVLDDESRHMLLSGRDVIELTLERRAEIDAFHQRDRDARPWIYTSQGCRDEQ